MVVIIILGLLICIAPFIFKWGQCTDVRISEGQDLLSALIDGFMDVTTK